MTLQTQAIVPGALRGLAAIVLAATVLGACQHTVETTVAEGGPSAWRVVERLGATRYLAPGDTNWSPILSGDRIPAASQVATDSGGRLILTRAGDQLSVGTATRFTLPAAGGGTRIQQSAGWVRYRVGGDSAQPVEIETPHLRLEAAQAVAEIVVDGAATEVRIERGQVQIAGADGLRYADLTAGAVARAGATEDQELAVQLAPDLPFEAVPAIALPAVHPRPDSHADAVVRGIARPAMAPRASADHEAVARTSPRIVDPAAIVIDDLTDPVAPPVLMEDPSIALLSGSDGVDDAADMSLSAPPAVIDLPASAPKAEAVIDVPMSELEVEAVIDAPASEPELEAVVEAPGLLDPDRSDRERPDRERPDRERPNPNRPDLSPDEPTAPSADNVLHWPSETFIAPLPEEEAAEPEAQSSEALDGQFDRLTEGLLDGLPPASAPKKVPWNAGAV